MIAPLSRSSGPRQGRVNLKRGTGAGLRLHPDLSAVALDDLLADGQADAVARIFAARVQALEDDKNVFRVLAAQFRFRYRSR